ncbi:hypothetical protein M9435_002696 [Picochlorum sp. BPE23]|nr:hypothetical protein M9435_002696 [Picochlorum sp. BPE23]
MFLKNLFKKKGGEGGAPKQQGHGVSDEGHHTMLEGHGTLNSRKSSDLDGSTLKEQLANKVRGSSSIPGSFYERDIEFKSKAYEERKAAVSPRNQGLCQVKQGRFSSWVRMWCKQSKGKLIMYIAPPQSSTSRNVVPEESCLGEPVRKIQLVGSHLESTAECEFTIIETDGSHVCFKCETSDEKDQWFVGLSHVPGLFRRVEDFYIKGDVWGHGATCQVHECFSRFTGKKYALKSRLHSNTESTRAMHNELRILQICAKDPHPAIPDLVDFFFDTNGTIEIVTDLMEGGELYEDIHGTDGIPEERAKVVFEQMASGVAHLHSLSIAHRDIKPENIMYIAPRNREDASPTYHAIKIMDYDLAKVNYCPEWTAHTPCGTSQYMAPEVVRGEEYSLSIDDWSLGVCLYVMLSGCIPFGGQTDADIEHSILHGTCSMQSKRWEGISDDAKDLIRQLLAPNPSDRLTASETLTHPWLVGHQLQEDDQTASIAIPHRSSTPLPLIEESPSMETVLRQGSTSQMRRDESFADLDLEHYIEHDELDMHE